MVLVTPVTGPLPLLLSQVFSQLFCVYDEVILRLQACAGNLLFAREGGLADPVIEVICQVTVETK